jgi:hypothetical protein
VRVHEVTESLGTVLFKPCGKTVDALDVVRYVGVIYLIHNNKVD